MSTNELVAAQAKQAAIVPFQGKQGMSMAGINAGAVTVEVERAIAEAQGKLTLAKKFPRDLTAAHAELMMACKSPAFAAVAFYSKPQGGSTVTGPSIRMAEQIAQVYGNFDYGHRELSRDENKSEVEVYAWDMEKNNYTRRQKTVLHVRDTRDGPKKLRDQTDVDQKINNVASKEMRGLVLAMMPKWLVEEAVQECRKTLAGNNDEPLEVRVRKMTQAFAKYGVKPGHLEKYLGHSLDEVLLDELVDLQGVYNLLREGTPASELFGDDTEETATKPAVNEDAKAAATAAKDKAQAAPKATAKPKAEKAAEVNPVKAEVKPVKAEAQQAERQEAAAEESAAAPAEAAAAPAPEEDEEVF